MGIKTLLGQNNGQTTRILNDGVELHYYCPIDLSVENNALQQLEISDPNTCQTYINSILCKNNAKIAYGGYLEKRNLYSKAKNFTGSNLRDIHLGMDFWCKAGTKVVAPLGGKVYGYRNNATLYDYGPTIILEHEIEGNVFYSLYGHLSLESLSGLSIGKVYKKGDVIGTLGTPEENVGYAPHLHFQLILDLQGNQSDYPGVCHESDLPFYSKNCPDPNLLLQL